MKRHPIDELFEKKLTEHEHKPSTEAWGKIQARRKEKRKMYAPWIWYAAAGLSLTLVTAYVVWQTEISAVKEQYNIHVAITEKSISKGEAVLPLDQPDSEASDTIGQPGLTVMERELVGGIAHSEVEEDLKEYREAVGNELAVEVPELKIQEDQNEIPIESASPVIVKRDVAEIQTYADLHTPSVNIPKRENRIILVTVQEPLADTGEIEKAKTSKFSRVLHQLKNVREGERVDWNAIGINTKSILARIDNDEESKRSGDRKTKK